MYIARLCVISTFADCLTLYYAHGGMTSYATTPYCFLSANCCWFFVLLHFFPKRRSPSNSQLRLHGSRRREWPFPFGYVRHYAYQFMLEGMSKGDMWAATTADHPLFMYGPLFQHWRIWFCVGRCMHLSSCITMD